MVESYCYDSYLLFRKDKSGLRGFGGRLFDCLEGKGEEVFEQDDKLDQNVLAEAAIIQLESTGWQKQ